MMPHEPVPADATASMMYLLPVPLAFVIDSVVSPAVIVPPHAIAVPPLASCTRVELSRLTELPIMLPDVIDMEQPTLPGYALTPQAQAPSVSSTAARRCEWGAIDRALGAPLYLCPKSILYKYLCFFDCWWALFDHRAAENRG